MLLLRSVVRKILWVGRTASTVFGLALVLALLFGVATMALAGTGVGDTFNLGKQNTVNKISSLIGSASSAMLKIDNNGSGPALALQVEPGHAPMTVNSDSKVANLNADKVDGKDAPVWAVIAADGHAISSYGMTGSTLLPLQEGVYELSFNRDISMCAITATSDGGDNGDGLSIWRGFSDPNSVRVVTWDRSWAYENARFDLVVNC